MISIIKSGPEGMLLPAFFYWILSNSGYCISRMLKIDYAANLDGNGKLIDIYYFLIVRCGGLMSGGD
jgi:hypothetical protein